MYRSRATAQKCALNGQRYAILLSLEGISRHDTHRSHYCHSNWSHLRRIVRVRSRVTSAVRMDYRLTIKFLIVLTECLFALKRVFIRTLFTLLFFFSYTPFKEMFRVGKN